jgi:hypothetical protein
MIIFLAEAVNRASFYLAFDEIRAEITIILSVSRLFNRNRNGFVSKTIKWVYT